MHISIHYLKILKKKKNPMMINNLMIKRKGVRDIDISIDYLEKQIHRNVNLDHMLSMHTITKDNLIRMKEMMSADLLIEYDWKRLFMTSKNKAIPVTRFWKYKVPRHPSTLIQLPNGCVFISMMHTTWNHIST